MSQPTYIRPSGPAAAVGSPPMLYGVPTGVTKSPYTGMYFVVHVRPPLDDTEMLQVSRLDVGQPGAVLENIQKLLSFIAATTMFLGLVVLMATCASPDEESFFTSHLFVTSCTWS